MGFFVFTQCRKKNDVVFCNHVILRIHSLNLAKQRATKQA